MLDAKERRVILPTEMSVENQHGFVACAMARLAGQPVMVPATPMVPVVLSAILSPTQHKQ